MPLSGYTADLPDEILLNPAVIYIGTSAIGVTRGGVQWDPGVTFGEVAFDGKRSPVEGLVRQETFAPKMTFTLLQLGTAAEVQRLHPGATTATSTDTNITTIITPKDAGVLLDTADYLADVRAIWELGDGNYFAIHLPKAYCSKPAINGADTGEGEIPIELSGVLPSSGSLGDAPFSYELRSGLPA